MKIIRKTLAVDFGRGKTLNYVLMTPLENLQHRIIKCDHCQRLINHCLSIGKIKKLSFRRQEYWAKPVPGFGDPSAQIWIVGLAPGAHGANRTGRMFTGDRSGLWLFKALFEAGFSNKESSIDLKDSLELKNVYISAALRCAPPDNKPLPIEIINCAPYLDEEYRHLQKAWLFIGLGKTAFDSILKLLVRQKIEIPKPKPVFKHGAYYEFGNKAVLASYHPSQQNTQTGRLTKPMWDTIFKMAKVKVALKNHPSGKGNFV